MYRNIDPDKAGQKCSSEAMIACVARTMLLPVRGRSGYRY
jgi:hypothetical protein